ncbi:hypothetical protein Hdeb2414_s0004g00142051 [Helianthus debilis subsp. tardiflorus]
MEMYKNNVLITIKTLDELGLLWTNLRAVLARNQRQGSFEIVRLLSRC